MNYVWVVEMLENGKWESCAGIGLNKSDAKIELDDFKQQNPDDKFRLTKYVPAKGDQLNNPAG